MTITKNKRVSEEKKVKKIMTRITAFIMAILMITTSMMFTKIDAKADVAPGQAYAWGVDVSAYQKNIDWAQVKAAGCSFAIIRAYTSKSGLDPYFLQNVIGANAVGIKTGAYVYSYATTIQEAVAEANAVLAILQNVSITFPVCFDIEDKRQAGLDPASMAAVCTAFCQTIEHAGYQACVYSSKSWFTKKIAPIGYDKWVAQWNSVCNFPEVPCIWQQSSTGHVPGIAGNVDVDYIFKDYSYIVPQGFSTVNGATYLYNNYRRQRGFVTYAGNKYFCNPANAVVMTGWINPGGYYCYMGTDGAMRFGLQAIDGFNYYFADDGIMRTGLQTIGENQYLFAADGKMHTGWYNSGAGIFYFDPTTGAMHRGWLVGDKTYYFSNEGVMLVGLQTIGADKYYFNAAGELQTGVVTAGAARYYFSPVDGKMQTGLINIDSNYYYFSPDTAAMVVGVVEMADGTRYFDVTNGAMTTGWATIGQGRYYFDLATGLMAKGVVNDGKGIAYLDPKDGHQCFGLVEVGGSLFYIDPATGYTAANETVQIDNHIYVTDANGMAIMVQ